MAKTKTIFKISIPDKDGLTIPLVFKQDAAHKVWVDWGDGSYPDTYSYEGLIEAKHNYKSSGDYFITMEAVDNGFIILGGGWTGGNAIGGSDEAAARMLVSVSVGTDVAGISDYAFRGCENLEKVTFPTGCELSIGAFAFDGCCSLAEITLPSSIATLERGMFCNCTSLKKATLPTGLYEIEAYTFTNCVQLREVNILGVTRIGKNAFFGCKMLHEIKLGENCRAIGDYAFDTCTCLRKLTLGNAIEIGDHAFHDAKSLYEVEIPKSVKSIGNGAFAGCTSLKKIKMAASTPPVLASPDVFEYNEGMTILVPWPNGSNYKKETNWTVFEDVIQEVR